ncbi:MAG: alpha-L-glutamate ligase-like protein [Thermoanaerobaculia bacterium]
MKAPVSFRALAAAGVLGINRRNRDYLLAHNPRRLYPRVDDKLETKRLAQQAGIAVPELYGVVSIVRQVRELPRVLSGREDFVIKPAGGSGGSGVLVVTGRVGESFRTAGGGLASLEDLEFHLSNILSGAYSLGGHPDRAMIEYRVRFDPVFERISYQGVPDLRFIVFLGVPVMAMVRLPTRGSQGRANLHQGAIGAGIDLATGRTGTAVWRDEVVTHHPDTGESVTGVEVPHWEELLRLAASCWELVGLGYLGVDIVLDRDLGPLILELNARPGLQVQIANRAGLLPRLRVVERRRRRLQRLEDRVAFAREELAGGGGAPT